MNARRCCAAKARVSGKPQRSWWERGGEIAGWAGSTATLLLLPKCPACLAAYVAIATGIGISLPTASYFRTLLMVVCAGCLIFLGIRRLKWLFG